MKKLIFLLLFGAFSLQSFGDGCTELIVLILENLGDVTRNPECLLDIPGIDKIKSRITTSDIEKAISELKNLNIEYTPELKRVMECEFSALNPNQISIKLEAMKKNATINQSNYESMVSQQLEKSMSFENKESINKLIHTPNILPLESKKDIRRNYYLNAISNTTSLSQLEKVIKSLRSESMSSDTYWEIYSAFMNQKNKLIQNQEENNSEVFDN